MIAAAISSSSVAGCLFISSSARPSCTSCTARLTRRRGCARHRRFQRRQCQGRIRGPRLRSCVRTDQDRLDDAFFGSFESAAQQHCRRVRRRLSAPGRVPGSGRAGVWSSTPNTNACSPAARNSPRHDSRRPSLRQKLAAQLSLEAASGIIADPDAPSYARFSYAHYFGSISPSDR